MTLEDFLNEEVLNKGLNVILRDHEDRQITFGSVASINDTLTGRILLADVLYMDCVSSSCLLIKLNTNFVK